MFALVAERHVDKITVAQFAQRKPVRAHFELQRFGRLYIFCLVENHLAFADGVQVHIDSGVLAFALRRKASFVETNTAQHWIGKDNVLGHAHASRPCVQHASALLIVYRDAAQAAIGITLPATRCDFNICRCAVDCIHEQRAIALETVDVKGELGRRTPMSLRH